MKRLLLIIGVIVIVVGLGVLWYLFAHNTSTSQTSTGLNGSLPNTPTQENSGTGGNAGSPTSLGAATTSQTFGIISHDPTLDYYVDGQNNVVLIQPNGTIETVTNNQTSIISSSSFQNIIRAEFSYNGEKVLVNFGDPENPNTSVFDVSKGTWTVLPQGMQSPAWSPTNSYQIAYLKTAGSGEESIATLNAGGASAQPAILMTMAADDLALQWPNKNMLVLSDKPSVYTVSSIWLFNLQNQTLSSAVFEYPAAESIWSNTTSSTGLVFAGNSDNQGGHLILIGASGNEQSITFTTLPSKCLFSSTSPLSPQQASSSQVNATTTLELYCAVPRDQQTLSITRLPDEYDQKILFTDDDFYAINTTNGALITVFSGANQNLDATDLKIFNNTLFFINRYDQNLYAISLEQ